MFFPKRKIESVPIHAQNTEDVIVGAWVNEKEYHTSRDVSTRR
jgi:hypothetical protein